MLFGLATGIRQESGDVKWYMRIFYIICSLLLNLFAGYCAKMSSIALAILAFSYILGPFLVLYLAFVHLFQLREKIYVAKSGREK